MDTEVGRTRRDQPGEGRVGDRSAASWDTATSRGELSPGPLLERLHQLEQTNTALLRRLEALEQRCEGLVARCQRLEAKNASLREQLRRGDEEIVRLRLENAALRKEVARLCKKLELAEKENRRLKFERGERPSAGPFGGSSASRPAPGRSVCQGTEARSPQEAGSQAGCGVRPSGRPDPAVSGPGRRTLHRAVAVVSSSLWRPADRTDRGTGSVPTTASGGASDLAGVSDSDGVPLSSPSPTSARILLAHVESVFAFLFHPGIAATNGPARRALRPAVTNRKLWGGNRTWRGAEAQQILMSVPQTCVQCGLSPIAIPPRPVHLPQPTPLGSDAVNRYS